MKLNDELLLEFGGRFLGYGNPSADYWFVGMEEGGGNSMEEIAARFAAWERRGKRDFDDMKAFCRDTRHAALTPWGSANAPYQKTWCGLIKTQGERENKPEWVSNTLAYQRTKWLTENGETCLLNLLPLPSPNVSTWNYDEWSDLSILRTRSSYFAAVLDGRINIIREAIQKHRPKRVIFVGVSNAAHWSRIREGIEGIEFDTVRHPAARVSAYVADARTKITSSISIESTNLIRDKGENKMSSAINQKQFLHDMHMWSGTTYKRNDNPNELYQKMATIPPNNYEIYLSFVKSEEGIPLCVEYKLSQVKSNDDKDRVKLLLDQMIPQITHPVDWKRNGKSAGQVRPPIISIYFEERPDKTMTEEQWFKYWYAPFLKFVEYIQ